MMDCRIEPGNDDWGKLMARIRFEFLETASNPFIAQLGDPDTSEQRLNFSQAFNPFGAISGALIGTVFIFSGIELTPGEVAYWPDGPCIALGYGRTPISKGDETRLASPCNIFASALGDVKALAMVKEGTKVRVTALG